jgi:hypothetical protein
MMFAARPSRRRRAAARDRVLVLRPAHQRDGRLLEPARAAHLDVELAAHQADILLEQRACEFPFVRPPRQHLEAGAEDMRVRVCSAGHHGGAEQRVEPNADMIEIDRHDDAVVERDQARRRLRRVPVVLAIKPE